ncbi:hypothetical protein [Idiomarina ramblicola]|uniref:Uncharacterized protein n=1 Tax=Idiomarina ramblicola TaxID=263724 RepID=A0A432Z1M6_9GAMM|nr:hypothetical protein [Idiomarina ramblicola]RUO71777.1 hypothetical protein CWI78_04475 [Idiomarina ramblicola]
MNKPLVCVFVTLLLSACSSVANKATTQVSQAVKVSTPDAASGAKHYQQALDQYNLFMDNLGRVVYQAPPQCNGVKHFNVVHQVSPEHVIVGNDEANGIVIRLEQQNDDWHLYNTTVTFNRLLQIPWPLTPPTVRLALYHSVSQSQAKALAQQVQQKWPTVKVEWSTNQQQQIDSLKHWFAPQRVGFHGAIAELKPVNRDADFYSITEIELQHWVDSSYALRELELRVKNNQRFYHWFAQQPEKISELGSTYGAVNRYPFCAQVDQLQRHYQLTANDNPYAQLPSNTDFNQYSQLQRLILSQLYITLDGNVRSLLNDSQQPASEAESERPSIFSEPVAPVRIELNENN